jgi:hypothetical protein
VIIFVIAAMTYPPSAKSPERYPSELVDPDRNRYRHYRLDLTTDLFGSCVLIRSWGRNRVTATG